MGHNQEPSKMTNIAVKPAKTTEKESATIYQRISRICNTVFHQLVAVVGIFILWTLAYNFENNLSIWHMILTTIAYLPVMAEAVVLFASDNVWTLSIQRTTRYQIHGALMFISGVFATIGISFMIANHKPTHFQSVHGCTGFISWIFVLLSQFLGVASAKSQSLSSILRPVWFKFLHNLFGMVGYVLGLVSLCFGLQKHTIVAATNYESRVASVVVIAIIAGWSLIAAFKSIYNQLKAIIS